MQMMMYKTMHVNLEITPLSTFPHENEGKAKPSVQETRFLRLVGANTA